MSPDELTVTVAAVVLGPVLWTVWLLRMSRVGGLQRRRARVTPIAVTLVACAVLIFLVLKTASSYDVVDAPQYQFMYVVLGLAWLRAAHMVFPFVGLSPRDDVVERGNKAAGVANSGALLAVTLCYAGGNVGNGPGWWVVLFSAALATGSLFVAWAALASLTPVTDAVAIDRDPAAGLRLGAFLLSCGLILGRGVAGDWESATATALDLVVVLPDVALILILAIIVERLARPTPARPQAPLPSWGILPSVLYLLVAIVALRLMRWPS